MIHGNASRIGVAVGIAFFCIVMCGCQDGLPAKVSGTITIDGEAVSSVVGEVMFHPTAGGAMAMAPLNPDGTYSISTGATSGLEPGSYDVTVRVAEVQEATGGNAPAQKNLSPARYGDREKADLSAEVTEGDNVFDFDLITGK